jgi:hypothetical protein
MGGCSVLAIPATPKLGLTEGRPHILRIKVCGDVLHGSEDHPLPQLVLNIRRYHVGPVPREFLLMSHAREEHVDVHGTLSIAKLPERDMGDLVQFDTLNPPLVSRPKF